MCLQDADVNEKVKRFCNCQLHVFSPLLKIHEMFVFSQSSGRIPVSINFWKIDMRAGGIWHVTFGIALYIYQRGNQNPHIEEEQPT